MPNRILRIPGGPEFSVIALNGKRGGFALIDSTIARHPSICGPSWMQTRHGYAKCSFNGRWKWLHHAVMEVAGVDRPSQRHMADHANRKKLVNTIGNLRWATNSQNGMNSRRIGSTGFKGVAFIKRRGRWKAQIKHPSTRRTIGWFRTPEEAARAYDRKARELFGEFALTNADLGLLPQEATA